MHSTDISVSETVESCSEFAQLLFRHMIDHQDDWGRMAGEPGKVKAKLKPLSGRPVASFEKAIRELAEAGLICWYVVDGICAIALKCKSCEEYQTGIHEKAISRGRRSKYPPGPVNAFRWPEDGPAPEKEDESWTILENPAEPNLTQPNLTHNLPSGGGSSPQAEMEQKTWIGEAIARYRKRLQEHTGMEKPPFGDRKLGAFLKQRVADGDDGKDFLALIDLYFEQYLGELSSANVGHFIARYTTLVIARSKPDALRHTTRR